MRIIGEIMWPEMRGTLLSMNNKLSLKIERGLLQQVYTFRDGASIQGLEDVKGFCDAFFISQVRATFDTMESNMRRTFERQKPDEDFTFLEII